MGENIVIEYNFCTVFYMALLKIFNGDYDMANPWEFIMGNFEHD